MGRRARAKGKERRRWGRKEGMNSKEVSEPQRFHSGNRFLIVERNMASAPSSILPEHEIEDIYAYHRIFIDFLLLLLTQCQKMIDS